MRMNGRGMWGKSREVVYLPFEKTEDLAASGTIKTGDSYRLRRGCKPAVGFRDETVNSRQN